MLAKMIQELESRLLLFGALGPEYAVESVSPRTQWAPAIAMDASGNYLVAWGAETSDGKGFDVYARQFDSLGQPRGNAFRVNTYRTNDQYGPRAAMDADGDFVVTWTSAGQDGKPLGVYGQRFSALGAAQGTEFRVSSGSSDEATVESVAMNAGGAFVITWASLEQDGDGQGVYARRYASNGAAQGAEFPVNTVTLHNQQASQAAITSTGSFIITWDSFNQDLGGLGVYARRYDAAGAALGAEFLVNATTVGDQSDPAIGADSAGNFTIAWKGPDPSAAIWFRRYNAGGTALATEQRADGGSANDRENPALAMLPSGEFTVGWMSYLQDASGWGIYARRFNSAGTALAPEYRVNSTTLSDQRDAAIAAGGAKQAVAFTQWRPTESGYGVFVQRFGENEAPIAGALANIITDLGPADIAVDLCPAFSDSSDSDAGLTYTVVGNSNPALFSSLPIDALAGKLMLDFAPGAVGSSTMRIRATDTGGLFAEAQFIVTIMPIVRGTAAAETITLQRRAGGGDTLDVWVGIDINQLATHSIPLSKLAGMQVLGLAGNDQFIIDLSNGSIFPVGGVVIDGGGDSDGLLLVDHGVANDSFTLDATRLNAARFPGAPLTYASLEGMSLSAGAGDDTLRIAAAPAGFMPIFAGGTDQDTLIVEAGDYVFPDDAALTSNSLSVQVSNGATVLFNASQHLAGLTLSGNALATLSPGGSKTLDTLDIGISQSGKLDLGNGRMRVNCGPAATQAVLSQLEGWLGTGRAAGAWNGSGIASSLAGGNKALGSLARADFVEVKYTYDGDANLDGRIDIDDYFLIDLGYARGLQHWGNGDCDYDGAVNGDDYFAIDASFLTQTGPLAVAAPIAPAPAGRVLLVDDNDPLS